MIISYSHQFIFIHIYKTAGSSIRSVLEPYMHDPERMFLNRAFRKLHLPIQVPLHKHKSFKQHISARDLKKQLPAKIYDPFFKFAFVRNPWDWQVSGYHFMLEEKTHFQHELIKSMKNFDEFIEWRVFKDKHLQKDFITNDQGNLIVDFVGRYETLAEDFEQICRKLHLDLRLPHRNKSAHDDYRSYYNPRTVDLIREHFREDIELFGYDF